MLGFVIKRAKQEQKGLFHCTDCALLLHAESEHMVNNDQAQRLVHIVLRADLD